MKKELSKVLKRAKKKLSAIAYSELEDAVKELENQLLKNPI